MRCRMCGVEARISRAYTAVEGDDSPDTETMVFTVQEFICVNPQCGEHGRIIETARHREAVILSDASGTDYVEGGPDTEGGETDGEADL